MVWVSLAASSCGASASTLRPLSDLATLAMKSEPESIMSRPCSLSRNMVAYCWMMGPYGELEKYELTTVFRMPSRSVSPSRFEMADTSPFITDISSAGFLFWKIKTFI